MARSVGRPARSGYAILSIFLVISLSSPVAALVATSSGTEGQTAPFRIGEPRVGDEGTYVQTSNVGHLSRSFSFKWLEPGATYDEARARVLANRLEISGWQDDAIVAFEPGHFAPRHPIWESVWNASVEAGGLPPLQPEGTAHGVMRSWGVGAPNVPCGLRHPFAGKEVKVGDAVTAHSSCLPAFAGLLTWTISNITVSDAGRIATVALVAAVGEEPAARLYFAEGAAYPSRMTFRGFDPNGAEYELLSGRPGTTPLANEAHVLVAPPPAVALVPRPLWGIDDSETSHPFPLSHAWRAAVNAPHFAGLREFLTDHPKAYVVAATSEHHDGALEGHSWHMTVSDGSAVLQLRATRDATLALDQVGYLPGAYSFEVEQAEQPSTPLPPPAALPSHAPQLRGALQQMNAMLPGFEGQDIAWRFHFQCESSIACDKPQQNLVVESTTYDTSLDGSEALRYMAAAFDNTGNLTWIDWGTREVMRETLLPVPPASAGSPPESAPLVQGPTSDRPARLPTAAAVAASAVAAASLLWLAAKALAAWGGFSRVEPGEHPVQRRILEFVGANPGIHRSALKRAMALSNGRFEYHLERLVAAGKLLATSDGPFVTYRQPISDRIDELVVKASRTASLGSLLETIGTQPGLTRARLAKSTGMGRSSVHLLVKRLQDLALLDVREGAVYLTVIGATVRRRIHDRAIQASADSSP